MQWTLINVITTYNILELWLRPQFYWLHAFFYKKPVYKKLWSNWSLDLRNQSSKLNCFEKLEKTFVITLEVSYRFLLRWTQNIRFYVLITKNKV